MKGGGGGAICLVQIPDPLLLGLQFVLSWQGEPRLNVQN